MELNSSYYPPLATHPSIFDVSSPDRLIPPEGYYPQENLLPEEPIVSKPIPLKSRKLPLKNVKFMELNIDGLINFPYNFLYYRITCRLISYDRKDIQFFQANTDNIGANTGSSSNGNSSISFYTHCLNDISNLDVKFKQSWKSK